MSTFEARYNGSCEACGERIRVGDVLRFSEDYTNAIHDDCDAVYVAQTELDCDAKREVCPKCWLLKPCGCDS